MIVSKETALLLKEKGYDVPCKAYWTEPIMTAPFIEEREEAEDYNNLYSWTCSAPTLHEVADWLRGVKRIHIAALPTNLWQQWRMFLYIDTMPPQKQRIPDKIHDFPTHNTALEAGIIHALKNYL
jgi:hypothetical protein